VLEATLDMEPELTDILDRVVGGECFSSDELPEPTKAEKEAPKPPKPSDPDAPTFL